MRQIRTELNHPLNFLASLVTLATCVLSVRYPLGIVLEMPSFPVDPIPLRIILFLPVEAALATVFGRLITLLASLGHGLPAPLVLAVSLLSAWASLFNVQWILLQRVPSGAADFITLASVGTIALFAALYFIRVHWQRLQKNGRIRKNLTGGWEYQPDRKQGGNRRDLAFGLLSLKLLQVLAFVLMFSLIYLGPRWPELKNIIN